MYNNNILVGVFKENKTKAEEYLNEIEDLLKILNGVTHKKFLQKRTQPDNITFVGKGFLEKIINYIKKNNIDTIVFDDELSLSQIKNIQNKTKCNISDRTKLILDIFSYKAKTSYSKIQVELAHYQYLLPRLKNMWTHLERQRGGVGLKGPGEKEIETDRRIIRGKIKILKKKLKKVKKQILIQRNNRINTIIVSFVGYTNVGKTTIINKLTQKNLLTENKYFTTLDAKINKIYIRKKKFLIVDTIGFISKIPTDLIESFKSSIIEIINSNIIVHVVDISSVYIEEKFIYVKNFLLNNLKLYKKKILVIFNKIDKIKNYNISFIKKAMNIEIITKKYFIYNKIKYNFISISSKKNKYIKKIKDFIYNSI